ncbi:ABC transporter permease [Lactobacillus sp. CC-MHH1034]|uniref:ABC transporter permease n=1 Tax=Agrilactobacillus fermenti TaxID=2586909 RepID=UPI001E3328A5|nr:ABC transporter permease [Agrilactobacillus fermenti]MCD2257009.1 ABC transporter permease [Agrilactobacillus fermenti]
MKRLTNTNIKLLPFYVVCLVLLVWYVVTATGLIPKFLMPGPIDVVQAFIEDFGLLMTNMWTTVVEAFWGLLLGVILGLLIAIAMDGINWLYRAIYPLLVLSQTIPTYAIAPILILWFGYGILPKVLLIIVTTFFPVAVETLTGLRSADHDLIRLMHTMGAKRLQILRYVKLPASLNHFFASLRISVSYSIIGAVIAEWVGGDSGLGVYMTRVMKTYAYDKMFAVIVLISLVSLILIGLVDVLQKLMMPWTRRRANK